MYLQLMQKVNNVWVCRREKEKKRDKKYYSLLYPSFYALTMFLVWGIFGITDVRILLSPKSVHIRANLGR
jgi:hypothetical protein